MFENSNWCLNTHASHNLQPEIAHIDSFVLITQFNERFVDIYWQMNEQNLRMCVNGFKEIMFKAVEVVFKFHSSRSKVCLIACVFLNPKLFSENHSWVVLLENRLNGENQTLNFGFGFFWWKY